MERLQKIIANKGYTSRRNAEKLILSGKVKVNNETITTLGTKANDNDVIEIDGKILEQEKKVYYIINKPREVLSTAKDDKDRTTILDLIDTPYRIYPIGRLDYDTTGLLLLTNDGELANLLMHPKNEIEKVYIAKVKGLVNFIDVKKLKSGVNIDGYKTYPARVKIRKQDKVANTSIIELTIHEGKNHQVRKMFEAIGYEVIKLKREKYDFLTLEGLRSGEYRQLTIKEVKKLYSLQKKNQ